jgi:hypothetical protein
MWEKTIKKIENYNGSTPSIEFDESSPFSMKKCVKNDSIK